MVRAFERGTPPPEPFDSLAVDLARFQAAHVPGYARLCAARGVDPRKLMRASDAPAVPTEAFKLANVFCFDPEDASRTFRTSGTTIGARGTHAMRDIRTYDAAAFAFGRALFARELAANTPVLVIGPPEAEAPDSSLVHMCALFARAFGAPESPERTFFVRGGALMVDDQLRAGPSDRCPRRRCADPSGGKPRHADGGIQGTLAGGGCGGPAPDGGPRVRDR
jgi:hypothetical protein